MSCRSSSTILPQLAEAEPNASAAGAAPMALPGIGVGHAGGDGGHDHVTFDARAGQTIVFDLAAKTLGLEAQRRADAPRSGRHRSWPASNDFNDDADPLVAYRIPADGRYAVRVRDLAMAGSDKHFYQLTLGALAVRHRASFR